VVITGAMDKTVSPRRHSRPFASAVPNAKYIMLPDVGHMIQNVAPELVVSEIDAMIGRLAHSTTAAAGQGRD
jgi:pimeloyl-ACP methyl ester carboxylesterase